MDSEGIRALDNSKRGITRDNEIATLVIGLSDVTIMNVKGENDSNIADVIQIAVHAFLRMYMHNIRRSCLFVHQNVSAVNAAENLSLARDKLVKGLNNATQVVAALEKYNNITGFSQIMQFSEEKDTFYIGDIWHGEPPMAPTNPTYFNKVVDIKKRLFDSVRLDTAKTVHQIILHLDELWQGIVSEEFVFRFKNAEDIKVFTVFDTKIQDHYIHLNTFVSTHCNSVAKDTFDTIRTIDELDKREKVLIRVFKQQIEDMALKEKEMPQFENHNSSRQSNYSPEEQGLELCFAESQIKTVIGRMKKKVSMLKERRRTQIMASGLTQEQQDELFELRRSLAHKIATGDTQCSDNDLIDRTLSNFEERSLKKHITIADEIKELLIKYFTLHQKSVYTELTHLPLSKELPELSEAMVEQELDQLGVKFTTRKTNGLEEPGKQDSPFRAFLQFIAKIGKIVDNIKEDSRFTHARVREVLQNITSLIQNHNTNEIYDYEFTPFFEERLAIQTMRHIVPVFEGMETDWYRQDKASRERKVRMLTKLAKSMRKTGTENISDMVCYELQICLKHMVHQNIREHIVEEVKTEYCHKSKLLSLIHQWFLHKNVSLREYIETLNGNLKEKCYEKLVEWIKATYFTSEMPLVVIAQSDIANVIKKFKSCFSEVALSDEPENLLDWTKKLFTLLKKAEVDLDANEYEHIDETISIPHMDEFLKKIQHGINKLQATMGASLRCHTYDAMFAGNEDIRDIVDNIWGCNEVCPICREPCYLSEHHVANDTPHWCPEHRPVAIGGVKPKVGRLSHRNCHMERICGNTIFPCETMWEFARKPYNEDYWCWFLYRHGKDLAELRNADPPVLENEWEAITEEKALNAIRTVSYCII